MTISASVQDGAALRRIQVKAALLGAFHPLQLLGSDADSSILASLSDCSEEVFIGGTYLWSLTPDARRSALAYLPPMGPERQKFIAELPRRDDDQLAKAFLECLSPRPPARFVGLLASKGTSTSKSLTAADVISLFQAIQLFTAAGVSLPDWVRRPEVLTSLQRAATILQQKDATRTLVGPTFRGRKQELKALSYFAETGDLLEGNRTTPPMEIDLTDFSADARVPALAVTGIGGVGKSALMDHLRQQLSKVQNLTVAVFDLDQVALRSGERVALTLDLLRIIAVAKPTLAPEIEALRQQVRSEMSDVREHYDAGGSSILSAISGLSQLPFGYGWKLLIIFDTFEEVLVAGDERVRRISDWLSVLSETLGEGVLRVIFSGRAAETLNAIRGTGIALKSALRLGDLGVRAGRARLRDLFREAGIPHLDLVGPLVAAHGSNALVLEIIARYCIDRSYEDVQAFARETLAEAAGSGASGFGAEYRQRFLYRRILERLPDIALRQLACPGLVLRRITPRSIAEVLAEPCGLETPMSVARAEELFDQLARQVWLVEQGSGARELIHRADLRRLMLPAILAEKEARAVAMAAAAWYERFSASDPAAELDALYYRIIVDPGFLPQDDDLLRRLALHLGPAVADLPAEVQARIKVATGETLGLEEIFLLDGNARATAISTRHSRQVFEGLESTVLSEASDLGGDTFQDLVEGGPTTITGPFDLVFANNDSFRSSNPRAIYASRDTPDLIRAQFADCDFEGIADRNANRFEEFVKSSEDENSFPLERNPAWLTLLSVMVYPEKRKRHTRDFQRILTEQSKSVLANQIKGPSGLVANNHSRLLLLAASHLGIAKDSSIWRRWITEQRNSVLSRDGIQVNDLEDWRLMLTYPLLPNLSLTLSLRAVGHLQVNLLEEVLMQAGAANPDSRVGAVRRRLEQLKRLNSPSMSEVNRIGSAISKDLVPFNINSVEPSVRKALLPGRMPELQAALRLALERKGQVQHLSDAVARATSDISWWPRELSPDRFERPPNSTIVSALITMTDDSGRLPHLVAALAERHPSNSRLRSLARLSTMIVDWLSFSRNSDPIDER